MSPTRERCEWLQTTIKVNQGAARPPPTTFANIITICHEAYSVDYNLLTEVYLSTCLSVTRGNDDHARPSILRPVSGVYRSAKKLPHWSQAGTIAFITWRTADSLPATLRTQIERERNELLMRLGLSVTPDWKSQLAKLSPLDRAKVHAAVFELWDRQLDAGAGACMLARPELSQIVADSLLYFEGQRYRVTDFAVMPNHVHVLVSFPDEAAMLCQCHSWKRFTAVRINAVLGRRGEFWQVEQFDHLVRSAEYFEHYRRYIAENPRRAGLREGQFRLYSTRL